MQAEMIVYISFSFLAIAPAQFKRGSASLICTTPFVTFSRRFQRIQALSYYSTEIK